MKKARLIIILISNIFMINIVLPLFKILRLNYLMEIIIKQLQINTNYVANQLGGNKNE